MIATVDWREGMAFRARVGSGHEVVTAPPADPGTCAAGASPMELILAALGSCTAMDVAGILRKMQQSFTGLTVTVVGERAQEHPKVFTMIDLDYTVRGRNLDPDKVKRAIQLSHTRYCSIAAMLRPTASLRYRLRIEEDLEVAAAS